MTVEISQVWVWDGASPSQESTCLSIKTIRAKIWYLSQLSNLATEAIADAHAAADDDSTQFSLDAGGDWRDSQTPDHRPEASRQQVTGPAGGQEPRPGTNRQQVTGPAGAQEPRPGTNRQQVTGPAGGQESPEPRGDSPLPDATEDQEDRPREQPGGPVPRTPAGRPAGRRRRRRRGDADDTIGILHAMMEREDQMLQLHRQELVLLERTVGVIERLSAAIINRVNIPTLD